MAIQTIPGRFYLPSLYWGANVPVTASALSMSAINAKMAMIFHAPKTGNIASIMWRTGTVTTGGTIDARLETMDLTTGDPSGTLVGTNTNVSVVVNAADDNIVFTTTLTAAAAVTKSQLMAFVLVNPGAAQANMSVIGYSTGGVITSFPYHDLHNGTGYTPGTTNIKAMSLIYDDGSVETPLGYLPVLTAITSTVFAGGNNPNVRGLRFQFPISIRVTGIWVNLDPDGDTKLSLVTTAYNKGAGTGILASVTLDKDTRGTTAGSLMMATFDSAVTLSAATNYRLIVEPPVGFNATVYDVSFQSLDLLNNWSGGSDFHLTTANNPTADGDWTNYNSGTFRMPFMGLIVDGIDVSGGAAATGGSYAFTG